jgi:hypothetical protein
MKDRLHEDGVSVLRNAFSLEILTRFRTAAEACFEAVAAGRFDAQPFRFTPFSHSLAIEALRQFGTDDLLAPVAALPSQALECRLDESWVRKRFAPCSAPPLYRPNSWHQDGGLGVKYSPGGEVGPMTQMLTCWIPLQECGTASPGLEFVRQRLPGLLHYRDLDDTALRQRFTPELFWTPELQFGDGILFLADILHRTHTHPEMRTSRLNLEYRFFPRP